KQNHRIPVLNYYVFEKDKLYKNLVYCLNNLIEHNENVFAYMAFIMRLTTANLNLVLEASINFTLYMKKKTQLKLKKEHKNFHTAKVRID
ncbi:hypothetical protein MXB_4478, partial [Myxobolus squamalis]